MRTIGGFLLFFLLLATCALQAQDKTIQDNSFLIEEAYNQETGVVQHIQSFTHLSSGDWSYTFTQEWPVPRHSRHQLSYTIAAIGNTDGGGSGIGDTALNYRYQLVGNGATRVAFSPRASLLLPSGSSHAGRGYGGRGVQFSLPLSVTLGKRFVSHWNAGTTLAPNARDTVGDKSFVHAYNLGQSFIWLAKPRFNVMLETIWTGNEIVVGPRQTQRSHDLYFSPGVRWAYNLAHGLQIVPGLAVPIGAGPSAGKAGVIVYLSFEHPMWHERGE